MWNAWAEKVIVVGFIISLLAGDINGLVNVARRKPASQSSTYYYTNRYPNRNLSANIAVDGVPSTCSSEHINDFGDGGYSHTKTETNQWWRVDLGTSYTIYTISICNRGGSLNSRLYQIYILSLFDGPDVPSPNLDNTTWKQQYHSSAALGDYTTLDFQPLFRARHLALYRTGKWGITLREVEINGFSKEDIKAIDLKLVANPSPFSIDLAISVSGFRPELFGDARLYITGGGIVGQQTASVNSADFTWNYADNQLAQLTVYKYKVTMKMAARDYIIADKELTVKTTQFQCEVPGKIPEEGITFGHQTIVKAAQANRARGLLKWNAPNTGCDPLPRPLVYDVIVDGSQRIRVNKTQVYLILLPYHNHSIQIMATNYQNKSTISAPALVKTIQAAPDDGPRGLSLLSLNSTCVLLKWELPPKQPNGIVTRYQVDCYTVSHTETYQRNVSSLPASEYICGFPAASRVNCRISAVTAAGVGPPKKVHTATHYILNPVVKEEEVVKGSSGKYEIPLPVIDPATLDGGTISAYRVIVTKSESSRRKREAPCEHTIDPQLARQSTFIPLLPYKNATRCQLNYYLAAILDIKTVKKGYRFPVGDGKTYGGIVNTPLEEKSTYSVYYGIDVKAKDGVTVVVQYLNKGSKPFKPSKLKAATTAAPPTDAGSGTGAGKTAGIVIGVCIFCVLVAGAIVSILLYKKRHQPKKRKEAPAKTSTTANDYREPPSVSIRPKHTLGPESVSNGSQSRRSKYRNITADYENCSTLPSPEESEAIPVARLKWYIESNQELIVRQYDKLRDVPVGETTAALMPENRPKCRYKDLYPVDEFRVKLHKLPSQGTDFINASYLAGYSENNKYIAAQGPTNITVKDFWLMIWQQEIYSIVMATRAFEANKMKCVQYWPDTESSQQTVSFGEFTIKSCGEEMWPDFTITRLQVTKGDEEKRLTHYQFTSWPDHDVPDTSQPFLTFYRKMTREATQKPGQILIHCSAGVGRTGAIVALDYLLEQAKAESKVDIYKCVVQMRERRPNMIQTEDQYKFVHRVLYDAIATEGFLTQSDMLSSKLKDSQTIKREFQYIEEILSAVSTLSDSGRQKQNRPLNRHQDIIPDDKYTIYLNGRDGQNYINAVRVNGYRKLDQFYATQLPLKSTVKDFWQMVHERSCKVIIQLGDASDNVSFYPTKRSTAYSYAAGVHTVSTKSVEERGSLCVYQLEHGIQKRNIMKDPQEYSGDSPNWENSVDVQQETYEVCLVKLPAKLCKGSKIAPVDIIAIAEQIVKLSNHNEDINVLVTSSDGAALCGLFICAFNCLESIRLTQEVEVYSQVLMAKHRRRQFITQLEDYKYIYDILEAYVEQFSQYQNISSL